MSQVRGWGRASLVALLLAGTASADPLDELGFGARSTGLAGATTATVAGAEAGHANPAGIARAEHPELLVGYQYASSHLAIDGRADPSASDARGTSLGIAIPFRVTDRVTLAAGLALYLPDQHLAQIRLVPTGEPTFARIAPTTQRVSVEPVGAIRIGDDLAFAAGASLLADARSRELVFDVGVVDGTKQGDARLDIDLPLRVAPLAGAWWRPHPRVELAAAVRGPLSLDVALDIVANVDVPGVVTGDATVALRAISFYTPLRASLGGALHVHDDLAITLDLAYERWSALGSAAPGLRVTVNLDTAPALVETMPPAAQFRDIVTPRLGVEWTHAALRLRAGGAYLPSPVPAQRGLTSIADGARTLAALGIGYRIAPGAILVHPIDLDLGVTWQHVRSATTRKDLTIAPGAAFSSSGDLVQGAASATVRF